MEGGEADSQRGPDIGFKVMEVELRGSRGQGGRQDGVCPGQSARGTPAPVTVDFWPGKFLPVWG